MDPITALAALFLLSGSGKGGPAAPSFPGSQPRPQPKPRIPTTAPPKAPVVPPKASTPLPVGPGVSIPVSLTDTTFPGPRWELDAPPSAAVQARAVELIPVLWGKGVGSAKIEDMGPRMGLSSNRPTAFKAEAHGDKKAVSAWRLKSGTVMQPLKPATGPIPLSPAGIIQKNVADAVTTAQQHAESQITDDMVKRYYEEKTGVPAESVRPVTLEEIEEEEETEAAPASPVASKPRSTLQLPVLRIGSSGTDVVVLQQRLGGLDVDGKFGPKTQARVIAYQREHGLQVDGVVGPETWGHLFSGDE
jgi:hypothetical protein